MQTPIQTTPELLAWLDGIARAVASVVGSTPWRVLAPRRSYAVGRGLVVAVLRQNGFSYPQIAWLLNCDHSSLAKNQAVDPMTLARLEVPPCPR